MNHGVPVRRGVPTVAFLLLLIAAFALWAWSLGTAPAPAGADGAATLAARPAPAGGWGPLQVMAANIRMSSPQDGPNDWPNRRELVVKTFLKYQPDLLLCQEVTPSQGAYLNKELAPWYGYYPRAGVGRPAGAATAKGGTSGGARGELMGVLNQSLASLNTVYYRSDRFDIVDGEAGLIFPDELQSVPSENAYFTVAVLKEKGGGLPWIVIDTHLRHGDQFAIRCAMRLRERAASWMKGYPGAGVVIGGDMNHDRTSKVYAALTGAVGAGSAVGDVELPGFTDTFDYTQKKKPEPWGTWHPFTGITNNEWPTDLVLYAGDRLTASGSARIVRERGSKGEWASDHFFVLSTIERRQ
jgi:endonuclease/exonuclease/phosphatase family metal-dependent hydrolase